MKTVADFFAMGGYAFYVWGSILVTFALLAAEVLMLRGRSQSVRQRLVRLRRTPVEVLNEK